MILEIDFIVLSVTSDVDVWKYQVNMTLCVKSV